MEDRMKNNTVIIMVLLALALLPVGCKKDTCQECSDPVAAGCPVLTKQCSGFRMTVQQCSGGCCTTDVSQVSCSVDFTRSDLRVEIIGETVVIETGSGSERTTIFINGRENGWVTPGMPEADVRCIMERHLAAIRSEAMH
jgi:hypothetical protein